MLIPSKRGGRRGTRAQAPEVVLVHALPHDAVSEDIATTVVHREGTSNASVPVGVSGI